MEGDDPKHSRRHGDERSAATVHVEGFDAAQVLEEGLVGDLHAVAHAEGADAAQVLEDLG